ncbi:MAG: C25 family cysteine peptidase [bacterium]|nr:C25 family cysteine peptidase [bacterium]
MIFKRPLLHIVLLASFFVLNATGVKAQKTYGFEWIKPYQPYYKFKAVEKGLYRIQASNLPAWFGKNARKIQLFKNGLEQPIYVAGDVDGSLDVGDFIEFYGEPNDGSLDAAMFRTSAEQAQSFRSIFSDTAVYFLTVLPDTSSAVPLRFQNFADNDYNNYLAEPRYNVKQILVPQEDYYYGSFIPADQKYYLSEYGDAEGMMSALIGQGQTRNFNFQTPSAAPAQQAQVEIKIIGASDFFVPNGGLPNHHVRIYILPNGSNATLLVDTTFRGYGEQKFVRSMSNALLGEFTTFRFEIINDISVGSDFIGVSYIQLSYDKLPVLPNLSESFQLMSVQTGTKTLLQFSAYPGNKAILFDLNNRRRVVGNLNAGTVQFLSPNTTGLKQFCLRDSSQFLSPLALVQTVFSLPNLALNYEFLIVSNKGLKTAAEDYAAYRSGRYKTHLVYVDELADYYTYGQYHPLAIRRYCMHLYDKQNAAPQFLLLLGRGYQNNLLKLNPETNALNLVPAIGVPSSDNMFTNDFSVPSGAPAIATGRIPASNELEAKNYLDKLKFLETNFDSILPWRKEYLHLSGGSDPGQQEGFRLQLQSLANLTKLPPVGSLTYPYFKKTSSPTDGGLKDVLVGHLNKGIGMMTFYGHGSLTVLDMDFGGINDLVKNDKPSFYYFNGCNIGNANDVDPLGTGLVYGKDYICANGKGAIGWLAHTNLTFTNQLEYQMSLFYNQFANTNYGLPVGTQLKKALEISALSNDAFSRSHALQLLLQGDPAVHLYAPAKPDYKIAESDLFVTPGNVTVQNDSLGIGIILHNYGKAQNDSLSIAVKRILPSGGIIDNASLKITGPYNTDTFYVWIKPLNKSEIGENTFVVNVNAAKLVDELNFNNNEASLKYYLPGSGIQAVYPQNYAVVNKDTATLLVQNNNIFATQAAYIFELDTSINFSPASPFYQKSNTIISTHLAKWAVSVKAPDSLVYYWRAKLDLPENEGGVWVTRSFTYIGNGPEAWHQQRYEQVRNASSKTFTQFNDSAKAIEFSDNALVLGMENRRWDHGRMGVITPYLLNAQVGQCISQGTVVLVFEPFQVDFPYELPNYPFNCAYVQANKGKQSVRYYSFNTNTLSGEQELARLIDSVPTGYYVAMFSRYSANVPNWDASTKTLFAKIGSAMVAQVKSPNTAWAIIGLKGESLGAAVEDTIINNDLQYAPNLPPLPSDPQDEIYLRIRREIILKWYNGNFLSEPIGPAQKYHKLSLSLRDEDALPKGRWWLNIWGVNRLGLDTLMYSNITANAFDLTSIAATKYPFLKLQLNFVDSFYRTPHQINFWQVSFDGVPELSVDINPSYSFLSAVINRGDSLVLKLPIQNLSAHLMDSTLALIEVVDESRNVPYSQKIMLPPIPAGSGELMIAKISTTNLQRNNVLQVTVNSDKKVFELSYLNNFYKQNFNVLSDNSNPFLEVTFDGVRIFNRDIVSPNPIIRISSTDKNTYLLQKDTQTFELYLKMPGQFDFERVFLNNPQVQFIPANDKNEAQLLFQPTQLKDGVYALKVQARDASGNLAGGKEFELEFTVVNKSTITHFYPYPNPFTTQMRFVFTLTGSKVPDQLLVRIMTINGKVIREVSKEEFGSIHIGNNVSEFAWDGTDQYGDKLANGIYLYQVYTRIGGSEIEHTATKSKEESSFFVNGTGKIYLMR